MQVQYIFPEMISNVVASAPLCISYKDSLFNHQIQETKNDALMLSSSQNYILHFIVETSNLYFKEFFDLSLTFMTLAVLHITGQLFWIISLNMGLSYLS